MPGTKLKVFRNNLQILCHPISNLLYIHNRCQQYVYIYIYTHNRCKHKCHSTIRALFIANFDTLILTPPSKKKKMSARMHNIVIDTWFVIRALFIANFATLIGLIFATILASSYIILICERPYPHVDQLAVCVCACV